MSASAANVPSENIVSKDKEQGNKLQAEQLPNTVIKPQAPGSTQILQALFFYDEYFSFILIITTFCLLIFKLYRLGFPSGQFILEAFVVALFALLCYGRISSGKKGNRIERVGDTLFMIFLSLFSIFCGVFFLRFQTYILVIEVFLHGFGVVFTGLEVLIGLLSMVVFHFYDRSLAKQKEEQL